MDERRKYYSSRVGGEHSSFPITVLREMFYSVWKDFFARGYFQEYLGQACDEGEGTGKIGKELKGYVLRKVRKVNIWPIDVWYSTYSEEDIFDIIEFLFDHVSAPLKEGSMHHGYGDCDWHYIHFDEPSGKAEFTMVINEFLNDYGSGYELSLKGEILTLGEPEFQTLLNAAIPTDDPDNIESRIKIAVDKFRRYKSTLVERTEAVRALADCLEFLRPQVKEVLNNKDEADLFHIANNFGIRHHTASQQTNYDKNIWLSWMFYFYLSTLHAVLRMIKKKFPDPHSSSTPSL